MTSVRPTRRPKPIFFILFFLIIALSLSCTLPFLPGKPSPTPALLTAGATASPTPETLPPALIESDPLPGSEIPVDSPITLRFNQPMNRTSVEAAIHIGGASGRFEWQDDATITFRPDVPLLPDTPLNVNISVTAQSQTGMPLHRPVQLQFRVAGYLVPSQTLPADGQQEVDPSSAIVVAFNRPVVPLGADPATLPAAFSLEPAAGGRGEWTNTSTFIFYPDPPLAGGVEYTVRLNPELKSAAGSPLQNPNHFWRFKVALPKVIKVEPDQSHDLLLDEAIRVQFNQSMDPASVEAHFKLQTMEGEAVDGAFEWNERFTSLVFTPAQLLKRSTVYEMRLEAEALAAGGVPLGQTYQTQWTTIGNFALRDSAPRPGGWILNWEVLSLSFNSPLPESGFEAFFSLEPAVENLRFYYEPENLSLHISGDFQPSTSYILSVNPALQDRYGQTLGVRATLPFYTEPLPPRLEAFSYQSVLFLTSQDTGIEVQLTNLSTVPLSLDVVAPSDFLNLISPDGYELLRTYRSQNQVSWNATFEIPADRASRVRLPLNPQNAPLPPGIYLLHIGLLPEYTSRTEILFIVSDVHLTYKISASDILVWAVQISAQQPVASAPIVVYADNGEVLASGVTGSDGVFRSALSLPYSPYRSSAILLGQPGEPLFSAAIEGWNLGVEPYAFSLPFESGASEIKTYLYTDRPVYRPGQTVYFRAIARYQENGRYRLPSELTTLPFVIYDSEEVELANFELPLSAFGSAHGEYTLLENARPGFYRLVSGEEILDFQVAEYRKPEIELQVALDKAQARAGDPLTATVKARYFFDAPAGNVHVQWFLYEAPEAFLIPDYQTGLSDERALFGVFPGLYPFGHLVTQGEAQTNPDGTLELELPNPARSETLGEQTRRLTLEVTATDESGLPVSGRASATIHPADFYIGIRPDRWAGQAGQESGYTIQVVDWENNPAGSRPLKAVFSKVVYQRVDPPPDRPYEFPTYVPEYTQVGSADFATAPDGKARLAFTAPQPGLYQLEVYGDSARTQVLIWFGGAGQAEYPNLPNQRLRLAPDRSSYQPGETAQVFIPNPFAEPVSALLTVERGIVMRHEVQQIPAGGASVAIPLGDEDAPNVYVSATLLGVNESGRFDFRQGYAILSVTPRQQLLNVQLTQQPERAGPRSQVTLSLRVTDADGKPVQGEFSLAVVDLAALALADPNAPQIVPAFYGQQPLGVWTSLSLAGYANRSVFYAGGVGGGGGGAPLPLLARRDFPDTAYWNAEVLTDQNGEASVTITLPDNLTTWRIDVRGLTADTRVGQATSDLVATKEVLVRPVTPRFLVVGDHALLAAIVQNNTASDLNALVSLDSKGFTLDEGQLASQSVAVPAGGRARVEWWGVAQDVNSVDLLFSVQAGEYQDAAAPSLGALPVLRYTARQAFATAGFLEGAVQQLELISLPTGALTDAGSAGELRIELAPSLAAAMLTSLEALEFYEYDCTEQVLARFLPNLVFYQALKAFNISLPEVESRLQRTLQPGVSILVARQNPDGGWGWWRGSADSSAYISAYALLGLSQAQQAGVSLPPGVMEQAIGYLRSTQTAPLETLQPYQLDRLAFTQFALAQAGAPDPNQAQALYAFKDQLSPWAQALLALALESSTPGSPQAADLLATLQAAAQRSATGAFWSDPTPRWQNLNTTVTTTAMATYALAKLEPASALLPDSIRFLMTHRGAQGGWGSTFETTWAVLAATAYMQGTGELAGSFDFRATLNQAPLASGQAGGDARLTPVRAAAPVASLFPTTPNALRIERSAGAGRLYYTALLDVAFPAEKVAPLNRGFSLERTYTDPANCSRQNCPPILAAAAGQTVAVRLTLVVPQDAYYVVVEDFIPAGSEILDRSLKTSAQGTPFEAGGASEPLYDPLDPFAQGWGWWYFSPPLIFDDHIAWSADYLPAGTYELRYTLALLQPGEYRLLPARAYQFYFPEVQGNSAGGSFTILP